ncbi:MAG: hypothetical protein ACOYNF_00890 [Rhodoferax sp.]
MNRCFQSPTALLIGAVLASIAGLATTPLAAQTLLRQFPAAALRGTLEVTAPPDILINGQAARLSPGARIKGVSNTLVMSGSLVGQEVLVNYLRDGQGLIHEVWILNAQEAQEKRSGQDRTNIVFESDADQPAVQDGNTPFRQLPRLPTR